MASLKEDWEHFHHEPEEFFGLGDEVVVFVHTSARGKSSGIDLDVPVGHLFSFREGKVVRFVTYLDRGEALRAAGAEQ